MKVPWSCSSAVSCVLLTSEFSSVSGFCFSTSHPHPNTWFYLPPFPSMSFSNFLLNKSVGSISIRVTVHWTASATFTNHVKAIAHRKIQLRLFVSIAMTRKDVWWRACLARARHRISCWKRRNHALLREGQRRGWPVDRQLSKTVREPARSAESHYPLRKQ